MWFWTVTASLALAPAPAEARAATETDPWLGRDKALHFTASAAIAGGGYGLGALLFEREPPRFAMGAGLGLAAGVGKELYDLAGGGDASLRDLAWDVAGTATGLAIAWIVDRLIE